MVGMAELPIEGACVGKALATSGKSGFGALFFATLGLAIGELNTGEIIFGFGGSTMATGSGFTSGGLTIVCGCVND